MSHRWELREKWHPTGRGGLWIRGVGGTKERTPLGLGSGWLKVVASKSWVKGLREESPENRPAKKISVPDRSE